MMDDIYTPGQSCNITQATAMLYSGKASNVRGMTLNSRMGLPLPGQQANRDP